MSAGNVMASMSSAQGERAGSIPSPALQNIIVRPIPQVAAKKILVTNHYLHSFPGCPRLCFGAFLNFRLLGVITFGAGPANAFRLVDGVSLDECLCLTRLWLSPELPKNSESRIIAISIRYLKKYTKVKFLVSYADPVQGHVGTIYQATGWLYTGVSEATPKFDVGDGVPRHSRSFSHALGSHSLKYLTECGLNVKTIPQSHKHRYIYLLDPSLKSKLHTPILPYPKMAGRVRGSGTRSDRGNSPDTP
jgi:hypothetical protein